MSHKPSGSSVSGRKKPSPKGSILLWLKIAVPLVLLLIIIGVGVGITTWRVKTSPEGQAKAKVEHFYRSLQQEKTDAAVQHVCINEQEPAQTAIEKFIVSNTLIEPTVIISTPVYSGEVTIEVHDPKREFIGIEKKLIDYMSVNVEGTQCIRCSSIMKDFPYGWMCK